MEATRLRDAREDYEVGIPRNSQDIELAVIGAADSDWKLRVHTVTGEYVLEMCYSEARSLMVSDLQLRLAELRHCAAYRIVLLYEVETLSAGQTIQTIWPPLQDLDLQLIIGREDPDHVYTLTPGSITQMEFEGRGRLRVNFTSGKLTEPYIGSNIVYFNVVNLRAKSFFFFPLFRNLGRAMLTKVNVGVYEVFQPRAVTAPQDANSVLVTGLHVGLELREAFIYYEVSLCTKANIIDDDGQILKRISAVNTPRKSISATTKWNLFGTAAAYVLYWLLDNGNVAATLFAIVSTAKASMIVISALLILTLWLPGAFFSFWGHCLYASRKFVGVGILGIPPFLCCGIIWLFLPMGLVVFAFGLSTFHALRVVAFAIRWISYPESPYFFPIRIRCLQINEVYMIHVRILGDLPRIIVCAIAYANSADDVDVQKGSLACIVLASFCISVALWRYNGHIASESCTYFDEVIMEEESD